jgi:hypothetical protein
MRRTFVAFAILGLTAGVPMIGAPALGEESGAKVSAAAVAIPVAPGWMPGLRDEAAMVLVGAALLSLAAAVRRAA